MAHYLDLARRTHARSVKKAQDSYFHGGSDGDQPASTAPTPTAALVMDEYHLAHATLPDFGHENELASTLYVTSVSTPMFSREECADVIRMAEAHFQNGEWTRLPTGQYDVAGFWIRDIPSIHAWFNRMLQERLFPCLVKQFPNFCSDMADLCVDNAYLFKYSPETGRRTDTHTDSGCLSFTIALNPKEEYSGGGTWFVGLKDGPNQGVIEMDAGQCTLRPGGVRHCGHAVTEGTRYIIGGFCMNRKKVEYVRMLLQLAQEYAGEGKTQEAQEALEAAILLNPGYDAPFSLLADVLKKRGDDATAKRALQYCLEHVNPNSVEVAYSLGTSHLHDRDCTKAKDYLQICLDADPMDVEAMEAMGQAYNGLKDATNELALYHRIVSMPDVKADILGRVFCNLGVLAEGTDDEIVFFQKSLQYKPLSFPASYSLGCAYAVRGQWDPAIVSFRRAVDVVEDGSEQEAKAIRILYTTVAKKMQEEANSQAAPSMPSQQEMVLFFSNLMGAANFQKMTRLGKQ